MGAVPVRPNILLLKRSEIYDWPFYFYIIGLNI